MASEKPHQPKHTEPGEPFISKEDRPDLIIDLDKKVGELTVRDLKTLLGGGDSSSVIKQAVEKLDIIDKTPTKDHKELKDHADAKIQKDHKDPKEQKDEKDQKDHKDPKEHKDEKDQKDHKDQKDQKDTKEQKDQKDPKEQRDHKAAKDHKELVDTKGVLPREKPPTKESLEKLPEIVKEPGEASSPPVPTTGLDELIERLTGLEREVHDLKGKGAGPGK